MMRSTLLFLFLCFLVSCQQEQFDILDSVSPETPMQDQRLAYLDDLHPTIMQSAWWQDLSPGIQQFVRLELSQSGDPVTLDELQDRMHQVSAQSASRAQACPGFPANPEGDVTLNSQADVNAFGALKCKEIVGALMVEDTLGPDPICDLSPLKGLKKIGSSLSVISDCLTNLNGLEKLKSVGELGPFGFVGVIGANLVDIEALSKLSVITGSINIIDCDQLTSVTGAFSQITTIESGKAAVPLTSIYVLNINDNALLTDISAFNGLTYIEGGLRIISSGALQDLDDFSGLNDIGDDILIFENTALQNVNELSNISALADDLLVFDNPSLTQCCGLYNLVCSNPPVCTTNGVAGTLFIDNNGVGCTEADIIANGPCP